MPFDKYKAEVLRFADKVEGYYADCRPKVIPTDEFDRNGYGAFWNEWRRRYDEAVLDSTQSKRIQHIRFAERESHEQIYTSATLFEKGSWLEKPVKTVMDLLPLFDQYQSINALDLGCGVGRNAIPIVQYFENRQCHIDCVDLLSVAIQKLNENAKHYAVTDSIQGIISSIEAFSIKESSYDLIIAVSSLEHIENETLFNNKLQEIQSGLRENGIACFILNSEVCEYDPNANEQLDPQFEVNLPTQRLLEIMDTTFKGENVLKKVSSQQYPIPRGNSVIDLTTNVVTFVTRKSYTL